MAKTIKLDAVKEACRLGNKTACQLTLRFASAIFGAAHLSFSNIELDDENPNKMPFTGVLLLVNAPSTKPPHGSRGHRILVPKSVAKERLSGLIGMGLNYEPHLESHAPRRKVGVITEAWIDGDKVKVKGFVYKKDFPEVEDDFKQGRLGMSMELANVYVRDEDADVWYLEDFHFTGATVLKKEAAAYYQTALAAKADKAHVLRGKGEKVMPKPNKKEQRKVSASSESPQLELLAKAVTKGLSPVLAPVVEGIQAQGETLTALRGELQDMRELFQISAAAHEDDDDMEARHEDDDDDMEAGEDDDDDDDMEAARQAPPQQDDEDDDADEEDDNDEDDMRAMEDLEEEAADEEPGEVNKKRGDKNKGNKTSVTDPPKQGAKVKGNIAEGRLHSAGMRARKMKAGKPFPGLKSSAVGIQAAAFIGDLQAQVRQLRKEIQLRDVHAAKLEKKYSKLHNRYEAMEAQVARYAETEGRRSLPADIINLLAKSNVDAHELHASGMKLSVGQFDEILDNSGLGLDPTQRMTLKNKALELGVMEQGEVRRVQ